MENTKWLAWSYLVTGVTRNKTEQTAIVKLKDEIDGFVLAV